MSEYHPPPGGGQQPHNIAQAVTEVSERASLLVREEIELAKAELTEKTTRLLRGAVVGLAAGLFLVMAVILALVGCAWLLYYYLPGNDFTSSVQRGEKNPFVIIARLQGTSSDTRSARLALTWTPPKIAAASSR